MRQWARLATTRTPVERAHHGGRYESGAICPTVSPAAAGLFEIVE